MDSYTRVHACALHNKPNQVVQDMPTDYLNLYSD